ncbi:MAG: hypothetical protein JWO74_454 [Solirubrobacterales bacterium]|nr:hypothetical protein [Solirubrobacterales bacterium]
MAGLLRCLPMTRKQSEEPRRELAYRVAEGLEVQLLWRASDDSVAVVVHPSRAGASFEFRVEPDHALNAFRHPYLYAALRRIHDERSRRAA